jgi:hypothetical protein
MKLVLAVFALAAAALFLFVQPDPTALGGTITPSPSPLHVSPANFDGHACIDANCSSAMLGHPVVAKIGDVECGQTQIAFPISDGQEQSLYYISVAPAEMTPGCGTEGATVNFYIDVRRANQTGIWTNGAQNRLDIWVGADFAAFSGATLCNGKPCYMCFDPCPTALITAYVGDTFCGSMRPYGYLIANYYGPLTVQSSDAKPGCGTPGATVTFKIDGRDVFETVAWSGGFHQLNLTAGDVIWGDNDCSGRLDAGDALRVLRVIIQMQPDPPLCFSLMQRLALRSSSLQVQWGDIDCSGDLTPLDALKTLLAASTVAIEQASGCPPPGSVLQALPLDSP